MNYIIFDLEVTCWENDRKRGVGMERALSMLELPLEGTHHRGIDDAKNIAKIFVKIFDQLKF